MAIQDDFTLNYTAKTITHTSGTARYSMNALYSYIMDLFDDAGQMDDTVPMSAQTPTEYSMINGWTFGTDATVGYLLGGSVVVQKATTDRDVWANFYTLGTIEADAVVYWLQGGASVAAHPGYSSGHIDQLVKVVSAGADVDSRNVAAYIRNNASGNADLYDHFVGQASATGGRNPVPLATSPDTNDTGGGATHIGSATITFGTVAEDVDSDGTAENWAVSVDCAGALSSAQAYEALKYVTRRGSATSLNGTQGQFYTRANGAYPEVKPAPFGTYAGGKFFGARGVLLKNITDPNNRVLVDSAGVSRTPPTTVTVQVTGVVSGDRVMVARVTGAVGSGSTVINKSQFTLSGTHTSATTVTVNEVLANDIPASGVLRLGDTRVTYSGINRPSKQFTGVSPALSGAANAALYSPLIDDAAGGTSMSTSLVFASSFAFTARVRRKGIQPFENTGDLTGSSVAVSAIRTTDTIVT